MRLIPVLGLVLIGSLSLAAEEHAVHAEPAAVPSAPASAEHSAAPAEHPAPSAAPGGLTLSNAQALQKLMEGNARYVAGKTIHPRQDATRRAEVAKSQKPFAVILTCADSRVPPEILFDQGLGDLFVLRVAGNVANDDIQASIEYAVEHLGANLVVVLGHERCGAVKAAVAGGELPGHLPGLIGRIAPAVAVSKGQTGDVLDNAVNANARMSADQLRASAPILQHAVSQGTLAVLAAHVDLDSGLVEVLW